VHDEHSPLSTNKNNIIDYILFAKTKDPLHKLIVQKHNSKRMVIGTFSLKLQQVFVGKFHSIQDCPSKTN
jgi:hypothetical protein